jgi:hypothetical protein
VRKSQNVPDPQLQAKQMFSFDFCVTLGGVLGGILLGAAVGTAVTVYGAMTCLWQVLYCTVLHSTVVDSTVPHCTVLCCTVLYCTVHADRDLIID